MDEDLREDNSCTLLWHWLCPLLPADSVFAVTVKTAAEDSLPVVGDTSGSGLCAGLSNAAGRHGPWQSVTSAGSFTTDPVPGRARGCLHRASVMGISET